MRFERLRSLFGTLRFRLTAWNTAVVLLLVILTLIGVREGVRHTLLDEFDELLLEDTQEIRLAIKQIHPNEDRLYRVLERKAQGHIHHGWFVQLFDERGQVIWESQDAPETFQPVLTTGTTSWHNAAPYRLLETHLTEPELPRLIIRVGSSQQYIDNAVSHLTRTILLVGAALLVIAPLGAYWLAGRATKPLSQIIATTANLQPSHFDQRLPVRKTGDELDRLSQTINGLLDRIASYLNQNRAFIANAAHDLRSPLAAIRSSVEVSLNCERTTAEYVNLLEDVMEECSALGSLVNRLLILAESDAGTLNGRDKASRLDQVVQKSVDMFEGVAESRGVTLTAPCLTAVQVPGDEHILRQVVQNLIENAIKFTSPGGRVVVEVSADTLHKQAVLSVRDNGVGIAAEHMPHVFERFYRVDRSRQREAGQRGNGLGLSICKAVVAALNGEIAVQSTPGQGSQFTVRLPLGSVGSATRTV